MNDDSPGNDPNESRDPDHRDNPAESVGVGEAVTDQRSEPREEEAWPQNDMDQPGMDPDGEPTPD